MFGVTFITLCLQGKESPENIDLYVEKWKREYSNAICTENGFKVPIDEYLGMNGCEYEHLCKGKKSIEEIVLSHRSLYEGGISEVDLAIRRGKENKTIPFVLDMITFRNGVIDGLLQRFNELDVKKIAFNRLHAEWVHMIKLRGDYVIDVEQVVTRWENGMPVTCPMFTVSKCGTESHVQASRGDECND